MKVKALVDHINDYSTTGPGVAVGEDRMKNKGTEYHIVNEDEAKRLIDDGTVKKVAEEK